MTARVPDLFLVTSGGIRAPRFEGTMNRSTVRAFIRDYDEYAAAAHLDREEGDTRRVARLLDLISTARKNSLTAQDLRKLHLPKESVGKQQRRLQAYKAPLAWSGTCVPSEI